ncbi:MAG: NAD(P)/FAD-dependent oxidoreductase [Mariprofundaceae bacterium]|nr:NAD(P)/FAD-dependent oxidoreductase [Mariprofundaceae bacterium]
MPEKTRAYDAIIIGAGAAGLMCAAVAGKRGKRILLLDHAEKPGKKILISGGGRCNFTNKFTSAENFISVNPHFCKSALARFSAANFLTMVEAHDIAWHERDHGQLFCNHSARDILDMLLSECRAGDVSMMMNTTVDKVVQDKGFRLSTSRGNFAAAQLIIASGGLSIPKMGATPLALKIAEKFDLNIIPPRAGLVPLTFSGAEKEALKSLAGIALDVGVRCAKKCFREAMLFTHRGLSGPAILQISSYWQVGESIHIDLLPDTEIAAEIAAWQQQKPQAKLSTALSALLPKRLAQYLCMSYIHDVKLETMQAQHIEKAAAALHDWQLKPSGNEGYRSAEVTVGGVDTAELSSSNMQVRNIPGLHFIGEAVDVTGHLGGFNFQWAWSSGYACGMAL